MINRLAVMALFLASGVAAQSDPVAKGGSPDLSAPMTDSLQIDADTSLDVSPGDTIRYSVLIGNAGGASSPADNSVFTAVLDSNTALVVGSVTTTQGSVTSGNTGGDTSPIVNIGSLFVGASATVTFDVLVDDPFPMGVMQISAQGTVTSTQQTIDTDDPDTVDPSDATVTDSAQLPVELQEFSVE